MKCPNCGEQIREKKDKMNFCGFCGTNLKTGEKSFVPTPEPKAPALNSKDNIDLFSPEKTTNNNFTNEPVIPVQTAPPMNTNYASPFEQMVKANAAAAQQNTTAPQQTTTVTPPSFNFGSFQPQYKPETANNSPVSPVTPVAPPQTAPSNQTVQEIPAPSPTASFMQASVNKAQTEPDKEITHEVEPSISGKFSDPDHDAISEQLNLLENTPFAPKINHTKNVKIRNSSDSEEENSITYMEYTNNFKYDEEQKPDNSAIQNKFSSLNFAAPVTDNTPSESTVSSQQAPSPVYETEIQSLVDQVLNESPAVSAPEISNPEPAPAPEPVPEPEPEIRKEKVINYIGQDRKTAENMLSFKGLKAEFEYVENEKEFDFVIAQDIPADTEVMPGTTVKLTLSAGTWSEWSENPVPVPASKYITETRTEFRKRTRTRTLDKRDTTNTSEFEDYKLVGSESKYSDWETDQYYTSEAIPQDDTCEIIRAATGFKYAGWFNPANLQGMSFSSPDVANFFNTNLSNVKWTYDEIISPMNVKPDVKNWKLVTDSMTSTPAGDPMISNIFFSAHIINEKSYAMKYGSAETEWYIYKRRSLIETIYHFEKEIISDWSEWTEWSETELTTDEDCEVESRTLSRSKRKTPNDI